MMKINLEPIGKVAKHLCKIAYGVAIVSIANEIGTQNEKHNYIIAGYGSAVNAIMESDMWSSDKQRAIATLKRDESAEFYKAVISIAESDAWSSDRLRMIQGLCDK